MGVHGASHLSHFLMVSKFLGPVCILLKPLVFSIDAMIPDFVHFVEEASSNHMIGAHVDYCFCGEKN